jgi:hypothetical protein
MTWRSSESFTDFAILIIFFIMNIASSRDLLVASEASHSQLGHVRMVPLGAGQTYHWYDVPVAVRDVAYAPGGDTVGIVCAGRGVWLYSMVRDTWVYANDERTDTLVGAFTADGRSFCSADRHEAMIVRDVAAIFNTSTRITPLAR